MAFGNRLEYCSLAENCKDSNTNFENIVQGDSSCKTNSLYIRSLTHSF